MKKFLWFFCMLIAVSFGTLFATEPSPSMAKQSIRVTTRNKGGSNTISRAPVILNIEITYDKNLHYLSLSTDSEVEAEVYLYKDDMVVGYASEINCVFDVYEYGEYVVVIDSEYWSGEFVLDL